MRRHFSFCTIILVTATGCGRSSFDTAPVHGVVTIDDKPLFQGKVMFAPVATEERSNPGKPGWGKIEPDGTYRLTTFHKDDGAVVGEHWVTIINSEEKLPEDVPEFARLLTPTKVTVAAGNDHQIDIKLTSEIVEENSDDDR